MMSGEEKILGKRIAVITAHPDDESYTSAGTIYRNTRAGGETLVICATFGEKGASHLTRPVTQKQLKKIRKRELTAVSKFLGVTKLVTLGLPDGTVQKHKGEFFRRALPVVKKFAPDIILSFGPDGISGHRDHIAAAQVAARIARIVRRPLIIFAFMPAKFSRQAGQWLKSRRKSGHYVSSITFTKPTIRVAISPAVKKRALRFHASQMDGPHAFTGFPAFAVKELLTNEFFRTTSNLGKTTK